MDDLGLFVKQSILLALKIECVCNKFLHVASHFQQLFGLEDVFEDTRLRYNFKNVYQVHKYEMRILSLKKHVIFGRMIKTASFKACSIACYTFFPSICE